MGQTGTAELFDNTGAAIPRTTFGRCRWIVSEDSTIGSGEVVAVDTDNNNEITEVEIHYGGSGFEESPFVQITSDSGLGANFTPFGSKIGGILKAIAVTPGVNYGKNSTVSSQEKTTPWTTAKGIARTDIVVDFDGKYLDSRGFLSGDSVVQDGRLYTPWSYVVGSDMQYEEWVGPISKIAHPVGTKIFPTYYINNTTSASSISYTDVDDPE
jgi:hypothetical protein